MNRLQCHMQHVRHLNMFVGSLAARPKPTRPMCHMQPTMYGIAAALYFAAAMCAAPGTDRWTN